MKIAVGAPAPEVRAGSRGFWPLRDLPVVAWLLGVAVVSLVHPFLPAPRWLMIHLLVLGAAGHAILVWSRYFADTLMRLPATPRRVQSQRLLLFNVGVLLVAMGVPSTLWWLVVVGALSIGVAVAWHVESLVRGLRTSFVSRFSSTLWFYVAAGVLLLVGVTLGTWLAVDPGEPLHTRLQLAHVAVNLLGWIGLTVLGTVVTLGPTMLRTRIVDGAERRARQALPVLLGGIALVVAAAWADVVLLVPAGLLLYAVGVALVTWPLVVAARRKPPVSFPSWSLAAGMVWLVGLLLALVVQAAWDVTHAGSWLEVGRSFEQYAPFLAAGFVAQVLLGALSYLIPVVLGGGPAAVRATNRDLDAGGALRVSLNNLGLLVCVLPVPSLVRVVASALVLAALASFVPILVRAIRRRHTAPVDAHETTPRPLGQTTGMAVVGLALVITAVAFGGSLDPARLAGPPLSAADGVTATGHTTTVTVEAKDMRFTPALIEVPVGDRLVITVENTDRTDVHDLVLETGHDTERLAPGESAVIDAGVIGRDLDGWCSVVGHKQMGMVLAIEAVGAPVAATDPGTPPADDAGADAHAGHGMALGEPADVTDIRDPVLSPLMPGRVHRHTFTITEQGMEVAPGITQEMWTYNGSAPGPTLHGRVGDTFIIRLVNEGALGHSIDFHAGQRAPDKVMVTIPPGESLTYRFTANRAGIWMYHCSSMPMSAHIANGLYGAVVIDPPNLPAVDKSYVLVQSEHYYGRDGHPVDVDKLQAEKPDAVVFNGYHNAYDHAPIQVKVGERVRIWVLDAGPNRPLSFHVVGVQFDRTWFEGNWLLGSAEAPSRTGGSQTLALAAAQGGFVEMVFDEPGRYPLVNHVMIDAERGAHG
ncbi:MAG: multicopper oxidase domain-containing protein, partial [Nocardioides sp.]|nr:multicopper oxidase domain-containing protein [Nocardioides sp.]